MTTDELIRRGARDYRRVAKRWVLRMLAAALDLVAAGTARVL